jgi:REP element-mobilizing transposase RayT
MTTARSSRHDLSRPGWYHCISRCVRRAFLCGRDAGGRSLEHRKLWIRDRLRALVDLFAADVGGYAVLSNHVHVVVRMDPERVAAWSDLEVAERWCRLYPGAYDELGQPVPPTSEQIQGFASMADRVAQARERLGNLSWFMRALKEPVARRANKEDGCSGAFWQARFTSVALLDEAALAACLVYVDLNPIRARVRQHDVDGAGQPCVEVVQTPEDSDGTSVQERIEVDQPAVAHASARRRALIEQECAEDAALLAVPRGGNASREAEAAWLVPIEAMLPGSDRAWYVALVDQSARLGTRRRLALCRLGYRPCLHAWACRPLHGG